MAPPLGRYCPASVWLGKSIRLDFGFYCLGWVLGKRITGWVQWRTYSTLRGCHILIYYWVTWANYLAFQSLGFPTYKSQNNTESEGCSVVCDCLQPHGQYSPRNSPGQNTGMGSLSLLQGIFPTQGSNPGLPHCRQILYQLSHKGSPRILEGVAYPFSRRSSWPRNWTEVSWIASGFFTNWPIRDSTSKVARRLNEIQFVNHLAWCLSRSPKAFNKMVAVIISCFSCDLLLQNKKSLPCFILFWEI